MACVRYQKLLTPAHTLVQTPDTPAGHSHTTRRMFFALLLTDLAVVKVDGVPKQQLKPLPLGTSASGRLRVGQLCLAIGNRKFQHLLGVLLTQAYS